MKILMDTQTFDIQSFGGISRYCTEILKRQHSPIQSICPIVYTDNLHLKECFPSLHGMSFFDKLAYYFQGDFSKRKKRNRIKKINEASTIKRLKDQDFDVFIPTYYDSYFLKYIKDKPFVLTVHDMIHELMKNHIAYDKELIENKKKLIEKATKIIVVSKNTKNDILKLYPHTNPDKIEVVYLSQSIINKRDTQLNLPKKYILFVGNRADYKNFNFFLEAMKPLLQEDKDLFIVCAGGGKLRTKERQFIQQFNIKDRVLQFDFKDYELFDYYNNAKCFVFPSMYEGFGIPVLEAMKAECPIVLANHSSFPEVAEQAALYFDLEDKIDLTNKIKQFIDNEDLRQEYITKGNQQVSKFSWDKTAEKCIQVYKLAHKENQ